jgi:hypothetical protein
MAQSSSGVATSLSLGFLPVTEKLTRDNYTMWRAQVVSALKDAQLAGYIKPSAKPPPEFLLTTSSSNKPDKNVDPLQNPDYEKWVVKDQQVLSYLFSSFSKIFAQVSSTETTTELWAAIEDDNASQSRVRIISTRMALATASKGASLIAGCHEDEGARR